MEFQAVVMAAGRGSRMTELTTGCPKCLLPVGNMPMIWYPLNLLKRNGFQEAIVIVPETAKNEVSEARIDTKVDMKLDIVTIPSSEDWGTAESIRYIKDKIKVDVLIISCDLITDFELHQLADVYRTHSASLAMLLAPISISLVNAPAPGQKGKHKRVRDIVGTELHTGRLMFVNSEADFEENVSLRKFILKRHPFIQVHSDLMDAHLYLMNKWLVDYLVENENITTIKGELLPSVVKKQFYHSKTEGKNDITNMKASIISVNPKKDVHTHKKTGEWHDLLSELSTRCNQWGSLDDYSHEDQIRCYGYIMKDGLCVRANTLGSYAELNRLIPKVWDSVTGNSERPTSASLSRSKSQGGDDSMVGEGTNIADKVTIKRSIIGNHCQLKEKVRLFNCVVMDHVTVEEGSTLQSCILCSNAFVGKGSELKDCIVGHQQRVIDSSKLNNDVILEVEKFIEI
ncbi:eukaryotic translation initiation factor 2B subunit gamma [Tachypleus tridentatus]|uniref:eukaryotic translation initiation factor 2B subunit gamma n=1 Tax=Tachypleus tridentatus TaxID=6853 RepID=UPI003FCF4627